MVGLAQVVRSFEPRDRGIVGAMLGVEAVDAPGVRVHVLESDGVVVGASTWARPDAEDGYGELGPIVLDPATASRAAFHRLILACVEEAIAEGVTHGRSTLRRSALVLYFEHVFGLPVRVEGRRQGLPSEWVVEPELAPFAEQLRARVS